MNAEELLQAATTRAWELDARAGRALAQLGSDCTLTIEDDVPTAQIGRRGERYHVQVGRAFLRELVRDPEDVLFVLLHELGHKSGGDLLRRETDPLRAFCRNVVADIRINRRLLLEVFEHGVPLLDRLYADSTFPERLLLPPDRLLRWSGCRADETTRVTTLREAVERRDECLAPTLNLMESTEAHPRPLRMARWYLDAWLASGSTDLLVERLLRLLPEGGEAQFLGDHDDPGRTPWSVDGLQEWSERGGECDTDAVQVEQTKRGAGEVLAALRAALMWSTDARVREQGLVSTRGVTPAAGRREALFLARGVWPTFFRSASLGSVQRDRAARIYVDVSASTDAELPRVYGLVSGLQDLIAPPVGLFSTEVHEISLQELREGRHVSFGGTRFDCVYEHALEQSLARIVVITDGYGRVSPMLRAAVERAGLQTYVVLTEPSRRSGLRDLAQGEWTLP